MKGIPDGSFPQGLSLATRSGSASQGTPLVLPTAPLASSQPSLPALGPKP